MSVDYKLVYKMVGTVSKHFTFSADNDRAAYSHAMTWVLENNAESYRLYKITTERMI